MHIAVVGIGHWGPNLVRNFYLLKSVGHVTACDMRQERLDYVKNLYKDIDTTTDFGSLLENKDIDAVVIALPAEKHFQYAKDAIGQGKHVLVEKPLTTMTKDAQNLIKLARKKGMILMVGHTFEYNSAVRSIKEFIINGDLGEIYYIYSQRLNLGKVRQDVNVMWNLAPHDISIILYWLEEEPIKISAQGSIFLQPGIEDVVYMNLNFPSGRCAHIHVSWIDPNKTRKMVIVGSRKMIVYDDTSIDEKIKIYNKRFDKKLIDMELPDIDNYAHFQLIQRAGDVIIPKVNFIEPLQLECSHFVECIANKHQPLTDGIDGLRVVRILEEAQKSLSENSNTILQSESKYHERHN